MNGDPTRLWDWSDPPFLRGLRPAILYVAPQSLSLQVREGEAPPQMLPLLVANLGDKDLAWQARTPYGVQIVSASGSQVGAFSDQEADPALPPGTSAPPLAVSIDPAGYEPGVHSLGAILVAAASSDGKAVRGSPVVIPVALEVLPGSNQMARSAAFSGPHVIFMPVMAHGYRVPMLVVAPPDILVNGAAQMLAEDQIQAFYGAGWHALERLDVYSWRWAQSPAEIYIHSPSPRTVRLEAKPVTLYEPGAPKGMGDHGVLKVTTNRQDSVEVAVQREQVFGINLALGSGWSVIAIESEAGNVRPLDLDPGGGDLRQLSFALDGVNLIEE